MIVDTPPVNLITDAAILAAKADGVILVARVGVTESAALLYAVEQLRNVRARYSESYSTTSTCSAMRPTTAPTSISRAMSTAPAKHNARDPPEVAPWRAHQRRFSGPEAPRVTRQSP